MKHLFIIISVLSLFCQNLYSSDSLKVSKMVLSKEIIPNSEILLLSDSVYFEGYLIFKISRTPDKEIYTIDSLNYTCDIYFNFTLADIDSATYIFGRDDLHYRDYLADYELNEDSIKRKDYYRFRSFYESYVKKTHFVFYWKSLYTDIFKNCIFWNYDDDSNNGYFVFEISLNAAVLQYDSYYQRIKEKYDESQKYFIKNTHIFLPVSDSYKFYPVNEAKMINGGFKKSNWYPSDLYNR